MAIKGKNTDSDIATMEDVEGTDEKANTQVATIEDRPMKLGEVEGDLSPSDFRKPRLSIAYGVGRLSELFNPGDLVLGEDDLLVKKGDPLHVIILHALTYWKEYLSGTTYVAGKIPRSYRTPEEVHEAGGTTTWEGAVGPSFSKAMQLTLLIKQPKGVISSLFGVKLGEDIYAPAVFDVDKSAYRRIAPVVLTARRFSLAERGLLGGVFELRTKSEKIGNNLTVVPTLKMVDDHNSDEVIAEIHKMFEMNPISDDIQD